MRHRATPTETGDGGGREARFADSLRMRRPRSRLGGLRAAQHTGDGSEPGSRVNGRPLPAANDARLMRHTNAPCDRRALAWELFARGVEFPVPDDVSLGTWGFQGRMSMQPHSLDHPKPAGTERRRQRNTCITAF